MSEIKISPRLFAIYEALNKLDDDSLVDIMSIAEDILKARSDAEWEKTNDESNY